MVTTQSAATVGGRTVASIREDFPLLKRTFHGKPLVYLDNAATSQKPTRVLEAVQAYYVSSNANVHRALYALAEEATAAYEASRRKVQKFLNASSPREIVFTRGTTEGINLVAQSWGRSHLGPGDEILLTEMEHHSNLVPWQMIAAERGARLRFIPFDARGVLELERLDELWSDRTRIVAMSHMSNVFGTINDAARVIRYAHERGVPVLLDAAQSVPHMSVDVRELDCDFLAFSGHKMCAPMGIGALYAREKLLEEMPPWMGGGEMISAVWLDRATWNELPYKFEAGTPNVEGAVGLGVAVDYLAEIGMGAIRAYEEHLVTAALDALRTVADVRIFGASPERGGVISFALGDIHAHDVAQFLDREGIAVRAGHHCAHPIMRKLGVPATARASYYFYNTPEEATALAAALSRAQEFFHRGVR
jgi:cysteine desulfurase / selenocysteine lyase